LQSFKTMGKGFWINTTTFHPETSRDVPDDAIVVTSSREKLPNGKVIFLDHFSTMTDGKLIRIEKKEANKDLLSKITSYMVKRKEWPPFTGIKELYKDGKIKIAYTPGFTKFSLVLPAKIAGQPAKDFLVSLAIPPEQIDDSDENWMLQGKWINPQTFLLRLHLDKVPRETVLYTGKQSVLDTKTLKLRHETFYRKVDGKESRRSTVEEATALVTEQIIKYMKEKKRWPPATTLEKQDKNTAQLVYTPEPDLVFTLTITGQLLGDHPASFLQSLKTTEEIKHEVASRLTWKVEHARSGRATCRECGELVKKDELRIGEPVMFQEHLNYKWYHFECARRRNFILKPVEGKDDLSLGEITILERSGLLGK